ncbi:hypothetical protein PQ478_09300 [Alkalihalophilus pseudofirmus]|uniref:hypothetical protein n=1 Tax=Alkalihalophilus pseudofirmus TaxID=79885 RepID=UPI00259B83AC|nr:hypothetical protein [Alkalihalophilus pseudofirmus]WEG18665.1 hypothetical protein PQ478_09300 [Alkalihalophilus pseudofirmus]
MTKPAINQEQYEIALKFMILPNVRLALERDLSKMEAADKSNTFVFPEVYTNVIINALDELGRELCEVRVQMRKLNLTVHQDNSIKDKFHFNCFTPKGKFEMVIMKMMMRNHVEREMKRLLGVKFNDLREGY